MWNTVRLAQALLPLLGDNEETALAFAREALGNFATLFESAYSRGLAANFGLAGEQAGDMALAQDLLDRMTTNHAEFTLTFRRLADCIASAPDADGPVRALFDAPAAFDAWAVSWRQRLASETRPDAERRTAMRAVIPCSFRATTASKP